MPEWGQLESATEFLLGISHDVQQFVMKILVTPKCWPMYQKHIQQYLLLLLLVVVTFFVVELELSKQIVINIVWFYFGLFRSKCRSDSYTRRNEVVSSRIKYQFSKCHSSSHSNTQIKCQTHTHQANVVNQQQQYCCISVEIN